MLPENLLPMHKSKGYLLYEVPLGWSSFVATYKVDESSPADARFKVDSTQIADSDYTYTKEVFPEYVLDTNSITPLNTTKRNSNWNVTILSAYSADSLGSGDLIETPEAGNEFLVFVFEVKNISTESAYISYLDFNLYCDGYRTYSKYLICTAEEDISILADTVEPKETIKGYVTLEVSKEWSSVEFEYSEDSQESLEFAFVPATLGK